MVTKLRLKNFKPWKDSGSIRLAARAKLVRAEFTQAIEEHWSRRSLEVQPLPRGVVCR